MSRWRMRWEWSYDFLLDFFCSFSIFQATGYIDTAIVGGVELLSDVPIRYNRKARKAMLSLQKAKTIPDKLKIGDLQHFEK